MRTRKTITMLVSVTVPVAMSAKEARREVRTLISDQSNYSADPDDVKVRGVKAVAR